ncbi:GGDEF domain-containing protein [Jiella sp. M17.18]|uniref:GGDEF domain-containing protein n=1 Tax=Jiella sp. M17.18 TaxID=3234247 RepID=UPI0034DEF237
MDYPNVIHSLIFGAGLMALVALTFGTVERLWPGRRWRAWVEGVLFAAGAIGTMMSPAHIGFGIVLDARCVTVAMSGAFAGWPAALVTAAAAAAFRLHIGGAGTTIGVIGILLAATVGLFWGYRTDFGRQATPRRLLFLGALVSLHFLAFPWLPADHPLSLTIGTMAVMIPMYFGATLVMGSMMQREAQAILREQALEMEALTDPLTGLANRRAFRAVLSRELLRARERGSGLVLLVVDIDHFKRVNDSYGHAAGDAVLEAVGALLRSGLREGDVVCRHGGEEFCVVLPNTSLVAGGRTAERIRTLVRDAEMPATPAALRLTVSIGVAAAAAGSTPDSLHAAADAALYAAKRAGRDRVFVAADGSPTAEQPEPGGVPLGALAGAATA